MLTPRRQALALAGVLAATTITGGALVTTLAARPATSPPAVHSTVLYQRSAPVVLAAAPQTFDHERGDS
jgi:hypothetical protein